ncbi:sulfurase [Mycolicibacterium arabiense]|uniref:Sulfurase n=2 Tax=Mycolicibacterium arabiense TaxID=1286181 RepID=A0A7I7S185_9MYCO|nr:sulfurase [Mycolicibacterium arabiense]
MVTMATVTSVNVGLPRDVDWNGRTVFSGLGKEPVSGPRMVRRLNVDGDGQGDLGGHGGENRAVLVYQVQSYRHWAQVLDRPDLVPGLLGENLTVDGLSDDDVCIGDRYRVGGAVLEVTQPRVTCYRAGIRIGEPRMAALLVSHGRPGFYCRVIEEGPVEAGLEIVKVADGPHQVSVAEINALLYLPGHPRTVLERALDIPALSPGWQASLRSLADQGDQAGNSGLATAGPPPSWMGFRPLRVAEVRDESRHVRSVYFEAPDGTALPSWQPGQSITLRVTTDSVAAPMIRNYSLSNRPGSERFRISVKREDDGVVSRFIHARVSVGDLLDVAAPRGTFALDEGSGPVVLLSAGVGVTPVLSMLHSLVKSRSARDVWWLYGARDGSEHPYADEVRELLGQLPRARSRTVYSHPAPSDRAGVDYTDTGRLSIALVEELGVPHDATAYLCGPASFTTELGAGLAAYGLDPSRVRSELFGAKEALTPGIAARVVAPHLPSGEPGPGPAVQFARSGISAPMAAMPSTLLEFAEACDVPARWSCRTGVCHNCQTALLSGSVDYDPEPLERPTDGNILICCSRPAGDVVLDL